MFYQLKPSQTAVNNAVTIIYCIFEVRERGVRGLITKDNIVIPYTLKVESFNFSILRIYQ